MYYAVAQRLAKLLLLQAGPQDLPGRPGVLQFAVAAFVLIAALRLLLFTGVLAALSQSLFSVAILALFVSSLLRWRKTPERFGQTLAALLLAGACIGALTLMPLRVLQPVLQAFAENPQTAPNQLQVPALALYAWVGISLWGLAISGHIYRHALGVSLGMGICVSLLYEFLLIAVVGQLGRLF